MAQTPATPSNKVFLFESKYPGLRLHLRELKVQDGDATIRTLDGVVFQPYAHQEGQKAKGYFTTTDAALADTLRKHKSFNKDFTEGSPKAA